MVEERAVVLPIADVVVVVELVHEKKADFVVGMADVEEHIEIVDKAEWALEHIAVEKVAQGHTELVAVDTAEVV